MAHLFAVLCPLGSRPSSVNRHRAEIPRGPPALFVGPAVIHIIECESSDQAESV